MCTNFRFIAKFTKLSTCRGVVVGHPQLKRLRDGKGDKEGKRMLNAKYTAVQKVM